MEAQRIVLPLLIMDSELFKLNNLHRAHDPGDRPPARRSRHNLRLATRNRRARFIRRRAEGRPFALAPEVDDDVPAPGPLDRPAPCVIPACSNLPLPDPFGRPGPRLPPTRHLIVRCRVAKKAHPRKTVGFQRLRLLDGGGGLADHAGMVRFGNLVTWLAGRRRS